MRRPFKNSITLIITPPLTFSSSKARQEAKQGHYSSLRPLWVWISTFRTGSKRTGTRAEEFFFGPSCYYSRRLVAQRIFWNDYSLLFFVNLTCWWCQGTLTTAWTVWLDGPSRCDWAALTATWRQRQPPPSPGWTTTTTITTTAGVYSRPGSSWSRGTRITSKQKFALFFQLQNIKTQS